MNIKSLFPADSLGSKLHKPDPGRSTTHMMLKLLLLAAVIAAAASIDCESWMCTGADCTIAKVLPASACGADVNFCLTAVVSASGSESKTSACDSSGACAKQGLTAGQCKTGDDVVGYCTTTTPPNGTIPTGTSCPTSAAPGAWHRPKRP